MEIKKVRSIITVLMIVAVIMLPACVRQPDTLEDYYNNSGDIYDKVNSAIEDSEVKLDIVDNDIIYTYELSGIDGYNEKVLKNEDVIEKLIYNLKEREEEFTGICADTESATKLSNIRVIVRYTYDGEEVVSQVFTAEGSE